MKKNKKKKKKIEKYTPLENLEKAKKRYKDQYIITAIVVPIVVFIWTIYACGYTHINRDVKNVFVGYGRALEAVVKAPIECWKRCDGSDYSMAIGLYLLSLLLIFAMYIYGKNRVKAKIPKGAEWAETDLIKEKFAEEPEEPENAYYNAIYSKNIYVSIDAEKHFKALNTLCIGASGTGKTRYFLKPNLMQMNCSYAITDPKGEILASCGELLRRNGYDVKVFDAADLSKCDCYNPLKYCYKESDIKAVVDAFIKNTDPSGGKGGGGKDPFWDNAMSEFMCACIGLLTQVPNLPEDHKYYGIPYAQIPEVIGKSLYRPCFSNLTELTRMANKKYDKRTSGIPLLEGAELGDGKNNGANASELAAIFENLRVFEATEVQGLSVEEAYAMEKPYCLREWENFRIAPEKTSTTVLMVAATRLGPFNIKQLKDITSTDTIALDEMPYKKTALFLIMSATDKTYNFLLSFMYTQLFNILYRAGEKNIGGSKYISLKNQELVKWFSAEDINEDEDIASSYLEKCKHATMVHVNADGEESDNCNINMVAKDGTKFTFDDGYYEIRTPDGEVITSRQLESDAKKYVEDLKTAKINNGVVPKLPIHFRFLIDEFPNIGEIPEFKEKLATMRGYNISTVVICQTITQLKGMYPEDYEVIDANCPFVLFLGGTENTNNKYLSEKFGKARIEKENYNFDGKRPGLSGGSRQENMEELISADMLGKIDHTQCVISIDGQNPIFDDKYEITDHKRYKLSNEYLSKCGHPEAMVFDREKYKIGNVATKFMKTEPKAIPNVEAVDPETFLNTLCEFLGVPPEEEAAEERTEQLFNRYSLEESSTAVGL